MVSAMILGFFAGIVVKSGIDKFNKLRADNASKDKEIERLRNQVTNEHHPGS